MTNTDRTLKRAGARLMLGSLVWNLVTMVTVASGGVVLLRLAERLVSLSLDWGVVWGVAMGLGVTAAVLWTLVSRRDRLAVAREVDEAAGLRESLSTALCVSGSGDPWSRAAVEHAEHASRRVVVRDLFPIRVPDWSFAPLLAVGVFFLLGLLPRQDLLAGLGGAAETPQDQADIIAAKADVDEMKEALREELAAVNDEDLQQALDEFEMPEETAQPEEVYREALKKLTSIQDRLAELADGEEAAALDELEERLAELRTQPNALSEMDALTKALQQADFKAAKDALDKLAEKMASSDLSEAEKKALAEQLKNLADQLAKLAEDRRKLEDQLEKMGVDPKLASDPEALQEALDKLSVPPQLKQQLMKQCKACNSAGQQCNSMSGAMAKAAAGAMGEQGGMQGMDQMSQMMSQLEMMQQDLAASQAAMQKVAQNLSQMGQSMGQCQNPGQGQGMGASLVQKFRMQGGGPGKGGGNERVKEADFSLTKEKAQGKDHGGPIVGSTMVEGDQLRGDAVQRFAEAVAQSGQQASDAIETMQIPRPYHDLVKDYYGKLESKAKPEGAGAADGE